MLTLINDYRTNAGKSTLTYDYNLEKAAMQRAAELYVRFDTYRPTGKTYSTLLKEYGFDVSPRKYFYGQLIMFADNGSLNTAESAFNRFIQDSSMVDIIRGNFSSTAVGHVTIEKEDYWVVFFSSAPNNSSATSPASGQQTVTVKIQ
jgi:uncharacterized protein YkwD